VTGKAVNKEASHYVRLFGGNKIGNLIFWLPHVQCSVQYTLLLVSLMMVMSYCAQFINETLPY
jgi:hypothetical protein